MNMTAASRAKQDKTHDLIPGLLGDFLHGVIDRVLVACELLHALCEAIADLVGRRVIL